MDERIDGWMEALDFIRCRVGPTWCKVVFPPLLGEHQGWPQNAIWEANRGRPGHSELRATSVPMENLSFFCVGACVAKKTDVFFVFKGSVRPPCR